MLKLSSLKKNQTFMEASKKRTMFIEVGKKDITKVMQFCSKNNIAYGFIDTKNSSIKSIKITKNILKP